MITLKVGVYNVIIYFCRMNLYIMVKYLICIRSDVVIENILLLL